MRKAHFLAALRCILPLLTLALVAVALLTVTLAAPARAELQLSITQGVAEPIPVAVPNFVAVGGGETQGYAEDMARVISDNLRYSGLFRPVNPAAFLQKFSSSEEAPRFGDWKGVGSDLLVVGQIRPAGPGQLQVDFRLYDVLAQNQMTGFSYATETGNWRRIAHLISDAIYKRVTGEDGYFDTRIVYVAESGQRSRPTKRLAVMDQDGANNRYLTDGKDIVLTPRFHPKEPLVTYLGYYGNRPNVYLLHIDSGRIERLGDFPGMTFAPRFAPDGRRLIFSMAQNGNSDIYTIDINTRQLQRLTTDRGIDTSASYAPDGRQIAFNSDRGGSQQLYVMDANGGNVRRISFGQGRYSTPVWSPRGDLIAFTKSYQGTFYIGVMRVDGSGERLLSSSFLDEGPTWSPNGRVLMFFRETRGYGSRGEGHSARLYSVDLTGRNLRPITTQGNASDPAWSALNPNY
jgi:TolB protein